MATPAQNYQTLAGANDAVALEIKKLLLAALDHGATFIHLDPVGTKTSRSPVKVQARLRIGSDLAYQADWSVTMGQGIISRFQSVGLGARQQDQPQHGECDVDIPTQTGVIKKRLKMNLMETISGPMLVIGVERLA